MASSTLSTRATKIVATIGPATDAPAQLERILQAGVDVVRINGAHSRPGDIGRRVGRIREVETRLGRPVGILLDLGGPKIRVGPLPGPVAPWKAGETIRIVPGHASGDGRTISVTYPALLEDLAPGAEIRIDDGRICLRVEERTGDSLVARVMTEGTVRPGAGVNFPGSALRAPALTPKDRRDLREGLRAGIDLLGLSFVRSAAHVERLQRLLAGIPEPRRPWVVAKIERREAMAELEAIAAAADALMVARGDLGVEIGLARVPAAQRRIISVGRAAGVPVIVATQMLESMVESPVPTRAEVSDVATAVHDGADAVMLSGETAVGAHPVEAVRAMAEIASIAEEAVRDEVREEPRASDRAAAVCAMAAQAARIVTPKAVVVYTLSGRTARILSKESIPVPIVAVTSDEDVRRRTRLLRNVSSVLIPRYRSVDEVIRSGERVLLRHGLGGETIVEVSGSALVDQAANTVRIRTLRAPGGVKPTRRRQARMAGPPPA